MLHYCDGNQWKSLSVNLNAGQRSVMQRRTGSRNAAIVSGLKLTGKVENPQIPNYYFFFLKIGYLFSLIKCFIAFNFFGVGVILNKFKDSNNEVSACNVSVICQIRVEVK